MRFLVLFLFIVTITSLGCEKTRTVEIASQPLGATLFIDGVEVGVTPYTEKFHREEMPQRIMASKLGYKAGTTKLESGEGNFAHTLQLEKIDVSDMVLIPAGKFFIGSSERETGHVVRQLGGGEVTEDIQWFKAEEPQREIHLDAFYIDTFEVTNADYKRFITATGRVAPRHWENDSYPEGEDNLPIVYVSWKDANAYCRWVGKRLPTEEEWEKASRGPDARIWPWGNEFDITKCNVESWEGSGPKPVGSYPQGVSPYGVYDMSGNVWEWTSSWYNAYPGSTYTTSEFGTKFRVLRGGSWYHYDSLGPIGARCASRDRGTEDHISYVAGFRCAIEKQDF